MGTFCWNHFQHLETYVGVPVGGMVTHTLNLRLHPDDLTYIATHGGDRVLIADKVLWQLVENFRERVPFQHVVAVGDGPTPDGAIEYEDLLASAEPDDLPIPRDRRALRGGHVLHERDDGQAERRCVLASRHRRPLARVGDAGCPRSPRATRSCRSCRCSTPMPGASPSRARWSARSRSSPARSSTPQSLLEAFHQERVTITAGVPTIWMGILAELDANPASTTLSTVRAMVVGGSAAPQAMIEAFEKRHGLHILHAWGMTEMCPLGTVSELTRREQALPEDSQYALSRQAGHPRALRRDPRARSRGSRPLGRPDDGRARGPRRLDLVLLLRGSEMPPTAGPTTAGSRPATSSRSSRTATSRSRIARKTWSSPAASGSRPSHSRTRSWATLRSPRRPSSRSRTRSGRSGRSRWSSSGRARRRRTTSCATSSRRASPSGGSPSASSSSTRSRRRPSASSARRRCGSMFSVGQPAETT